MMLDKSFRENGYVERDTFIRPSDEQAFNATGCAVLLVTMAIMFLIITLALVGVLTVLESTTKPHTTDAPRTPSTAPARSGDRSGGDGLPPVVSPVDFRFASASSRCESPQEFLIRSLAGFTTNIRACQLRARGSRAVDVSPTHFTT